MAPLRLTKRKIFICVAVLCIVSGSMMASGYRRAGVLSHVKEYADNSGLTEFLDRALQNVDKTSAEVKVRVAGYLGNSQVIDPLDDRPLAADEDPDLDEIYDETHKESPAYFEADLLLNTTELRSIPSAVSDSEAAAKSETDETSESAGRGGSWLWRLPVKMPSEHKIVGGPKEQSPKVPIPTRENSKNTLHFRFYSHNIKHAAHKEMVPGEVPWESRKRHVINSIKANTVQNTIVFLQEPEKSQLDDIMKDLNLLSPENEPEWMFRGNGRTDGRGKGEYVPIIFRPSEWDLVYSDTMWLNDANTRSAIVGWDAKDPRIATTATLQNRAAGHYINVINTHFDHVGETARKESAKLVREKLQSINEWPLFVVADLSAVPDDASHKELTQTFIDIHDHVPDFNRYGHPDYTVTGFSGEYVTQGKRIDYVFAPKYTLTLSQNACEILAKKPFALQISGYGILHSKYGGVYISDHRPIIADFIMKGCP